jgi:hypothetical protein
MGFIFHPSRFLYSKSALWGAFAVLLSAFANLAAGNDE